LQDYYIQIFLFLSILEIACPRQGLCVKRREGTSWPLAALHDRRMDIEEQICDTQGARFGFQLVWTRIKTP